MIGILKARSGNIGSLENALNYLKIDYSIIEKKDQIKSDMNIILPGVGSFHKLMQNLNDLNFTSSLLDFINNNRPFLGICVGMQILLEYGFEEKKTKGLGVFKGNVKKFDKSSNSKVPFISWVKINLSEKNRANTILQKCYSNEYYFLHSYFCDLDSDENVVAYSKYNNTKYPAIINKNKVFGVQFHPEKSRETGLQLLKNFSEIR